MYMHTAYTVCRESVAAYITIRMVYRSANTRYLVAGAFVYLEEGAYKLKPTI